MSAPRTEKQAVIRPFPLVNHLLSVPYQKPIREHVKIGLQNWLVSQLLANAGRLRPKTPARFAPRVGHFAMIEKEAHSLVAKDGMLGLVLRLPFQKRPEIGDIPWERELAAYRDIAYPAWYLQPQHSFPGGYLCPGAALDDRVAMDARYHDVPGLSLEVRERMAKLVPEDALTVFDFGAGIGDLSAAIARLRPRVQVVVVEASPFMSIVGKRLHREPNLRWVHGFAEELAEPSGSADAVTISLVLHETPDFVKDALLAKAFELLKPGGKLILCDVPPADLEHYRGAFEPYRQEWRKFDPRAALVARGFEHIEARQLVAPEHQWHLIATR